MDNEYKKTLRKMAIVLKLSQREKEDYFVNILGKQFLVQAGVFSPKYFFDTELYAKELPIVKNEEFLEIGCGIGVISIFAALNGASRVVAIDINEQAVKNTQKNVDFFNLNDKIQVFHGDVYSPLKKNDKFDTIFWNTPFGYVESKNFSILEQSIFDSDYKSHEKFISGAKNHLKDNGRLLIGFSKTLGNFQKLEEILLREKFTVHLIKEIEYKNKLATVKFEIFEAKIY